MVLHPFAFCFGQGLVSFQLCCFISFCLLSIFTQTVNLYKPQGVVLGGALALSSSPGDNYNNMQNLQDIPGHRRGILHTFPLKERTLSSVFLISSTNLLFFSGLISSWFALLGSLFPFFFFSDPCGFVGPTKIGSSQISHR